MSAPAITAVPSTAMPTPSTESTLSDSHQGPPPGIEQQAQGFTEVTKGGTGVWHRIDAKKAYTNVFIWDEKEGKILLGYKKRGFGVDMYNGFGGKVEANETSAQGALRELQEEAGIEADLVHCGTLLFVSDDAPLGHHIEIYRGHSYTGTVTESEEMRPEWFALPSEFIPHRQHADRVQDNRDDDTDISGLRSVPFDRMWEDDRHWFPLMLSRKFFIGRVDFSRPATDSSAEPKMARWWFGVRDDREHESS